MRFMAVFDLMFDLGAEEWQLDFPAVYGSAKQMWMSEDWKPTDSLEPLLDMVLNTFLLRKLKKEVCKCLSPRWIIHPIQAGLPLEGYNAEH